MRECSLIHFSETDSFGFRTLATKPHRLRMLFSHVFLGLAQDKLGNIDAAEASYLAASRIKDSDRTAWQGLITLYEKQGSKRVDAYYNVALKLGEILAEKYVEI